MSRTFTPADHQLIAMKISYIAEEKVRQSVIHTADDARIIRQEILEAFRNGLKDETIQLVKGIPQFSVKRKQSVLRKNIYYQTGFHANAITKGNPKEPGTELVITFPGTNFFDLVDVEQTFSPQMFRSIDYSEEAINYVKKVKKKYPLARIFVNGHSLGGKLAIQIGLKHPEITVYAFNPTAIDRKYDMLMKNKTYFHNINVLVYDKEIARIDRSIKYLLKRKREDELPFNLYHIEFAKAGLRRKMYPLPKAHASIVKQHSTGAYRCSVGNLWDVFTNTPIQFTENNRGSEETVFTKERYLELLSLLQDEIAANIRLAIHLVKETEETMDTEMEIMFNNLVERLAQIPFDSDAVKMYGDPRENYIKEFQKKYFKKGKYRGYDYESFLALLQSLQNTLQQIDTVASMIIETSDTFETQAIDIFKRAEVFRYH